MNTSYQRTTASDEWYTPREIVEALGRFALDPCAPVHPLYQTADRMVNKLQDGLKIEWGGVRVWCNPPYSQPLITQFVERMAQNNNGILLLFARVDNRLFQDIILPSAAAVLFLRHRIKFLREDGTPGGSPGCGSVLIAFGRDNAAALRNAGIEGFYIPLERAERIYPKEEQTLF